MTNSYDTNPRDLDREAADVRRYQEAIPATPLNRPEASAIRSRLATNLRIAGEEARNLETFYSNFARTLELCLSQLETKK